MDDLISRQAAIKTAHFPVIDDASYEVVRVDDILALPSAQPDVPDTNVGDMISRQAAINAFLTELTKRERKNFLHTWSTVEVKYFVADMLEKLPPAQPDIETLLKLAVAMAKPIEYLNLSVRSYNALKRRGVNSVAKVYELKQKENLKKIRNIGEKSADEIEDCLSAYLTQWEGGHDERFD